MDLINQHLQQVSYQLLIQSFVHKYLHCQMFSAYGKLLQKFPIPTKMVTSGTLFSLGDMIAQLFVEKKQKFDFKRNGNLFIVGATYLAPVLHVWYCKVLPAIGAKLFNESTSKAGRVFTSMAFDQLLFAPIFLSGFFIYDGLTKDFSLNGFAKGIQSYKNNIWEALQANWKIWPLATTVNFWFMPVQYQVLFANFVGLFFNIILSYIANNPTVKQTPASTIV